MILRRRSGRAILQHVKKITGNSTASTTRIRALCRALHDIVEFRIQLWQIYIAIGARRLRSLSMARASQSVEGLWTKLEESAVPQFDTQVVYVARLESFALAALLRTISHTARMQVCKHAMALAVPQHVFGLSIVVYAGIARCCRGARLSRRVASVRRRIGSEYLKQRRWWRCGDEREQWRVDVEHRRRNDEHCVGCLGRDVGCSVERRRRRQRCDVEREFVVRVWRLDGRRRWRVDDDVQQCVE